MNMDRLLNKRVVKQTVKDLKEALKDADDDAEVILCFNLKDEGGVICAYLGEIDTHLKYDGVMKKKLDASEVVELNGFNHKYCTYVERK